MCTTSDLSGYLYSFLFRRVLYIFLFRRVRILSSIGHQALSGLGQLQGALLLVFDCLLIGHKEAYLPDGIKGVLDVYKKLLGGPF
jgi:hypothetical protein